MIYTNKTELNLLGLGDNRLTEHCVEMGNEKPSKILETLIRIGAFRVHVSYFIVCPKPTEMWQTN